MSSSTTQGQGRLLLRSLGLLALTLVGAALAVVLSTSSAQADGIHGPYTLTTSQCAGCHRAHTGGNVNLLAQAAPQSNLCFTCHDGTGGSAAADVAGQYANGLVPNNVPATRSYYTHDALAKPTQHVSAEINEFAGVLDRHSECSDCHNPHSMTSAPATQTALGNPWKPSGSLARISGVGVQNGAPGTAPLYTFFNGSNPAGGTDQRISFEYQLCLKCHSGQTVLPDNTGFPQSQWYLDKGIELNPANASFHPIEAAGTNSTTAMANSLSGASTYRRWTLTVGSTVRCGNCHSSTLSAGATPTIDGDLAPHVSQNRGILLAPYRDRQLNPTGSYNEANFALCFTCHATQPFTQETSSASNFKFHNKHMTGISGSGSNASTDIDLPGAGRGNAICAECHFRMHSTALTDTPGSRLVSFSPNITANGGVRAFTKTANGGSCTLVCHGKQHTSGMSYP